MTRGQRWVVIATMLIVAAGLAVFFVQVRADRANILEQPGLIFPLWQTVGEWAPWEQQSEWKPVLHIGVYARAGHSATSAALWGLLVPVVLIGGAGFMALGGRTPQAPPRP